MIEAIEITHEDDEPVTVRIEEIFAELGPKYAAPARSPARTSREQIRLQVSWPRLRMEIVAHGAHARLANINPAQDIPGRFILRPIYARPTSGGRKPHSACDVVSRRVRAVLVFSTEGPGVEIAYLFAQADPALRSLLNRLLDERNVASVEFPWISVDAYSATPMRQAIHEYSRGRLYPGPDLVSGGSGPTLAELLPDTDRQLARQLEQLAPGPRVASGSSFAHEPAFSATPELI